MCFLFASKQCYDYCHFKKTRKNGLVIQNKGHEKDITYLELLLLIKYLKDTDNPIMFVNLSFSFSTTARFVCSKAQVSSTYVRAREKQTKEGG